MAETVYRFDLSGQAFKRDPFPTLREMRAVGPLVTCRMPIIGKVTFATHHSAVEALLKDNERFSVELDRAGKSRLGLVLKMMPSGIKLLADNMLQKDDPDHRRLRKLVDAVFRRAEIEALEPEIERIADELLDEWARSEDRDLVRHVARDLPLAVISALLGLPREDRAKFSKWMSSVSEVSSVMGMFRLMPAITKITGYMRVAMAARREAPRDDLISKLVHAEVEGDQLSEDEILAMCFLLFAAGHETTTHLISGGVLALVQHPDELARLRADEGLLPGAVDELLRFVSPVQMTKPRFVVEDTAFEGCELRRGQVLMALLAAANSDPAVFDAPEMLDVGREKNRHVGLGAGPHFCLGAWLARKEMEVLLRCLLRRAPELALAIPEADLMWTRRGGMRALRALPLRG